MWMLHKHQHELQPALKNMHEFFNLSESKTFFEIREIFVDKILNEFHNTSDIFLITSKINSGDQS